MGAGGTQGRGPRRGTTGWGGGEGEVGREGGAGSSAGQPAKKKRVSFDTSLTPHHTEYICTGNLAPLSRAEVAFQVLPFSCIMVGWSRQPTGFAENAFLVSPNAPCPLLGV